MKSQFGLKHALVTFKRAFLQFDSSPYTLEIESKKKSRKEAKFLQTPAMLPPSMITLPGGVIQTELAREPACSEGQ